MASKLSTPQQALLSDSVKYIKDALLTAYNAHHPVPGKHYDGTNIDYVFNNIIKVEYLFIASIIKEIANPAILVLRKEGIPITDADYSPVLDYAIMLGIEQLKKSGIYLSAESSTNTPKIRKLYIPDGHDFFRKLLSIRPEEVDRVLLLKKEEINTAAANALKAQKAAADKAAENLLADEEEEAKAKTQSAKAKKAAAASKKAAAEQKAARELEELAKKATASKAPAASTNAAARELEELAKKAAAASKKATASKAPAASTNAAASELEELARKAAAEYNAKKVANAAPPSAGAGNSPIILPNAGAGAPPIKLPNAPPSAGAGNSSITLPSAAESFKAAALAHMKKLGENPAAAEAARKRAQILKEEATVARSLADTRNARAAAITADPAVQRSMHWIMEAIHKIVYSDITVKELHKIMPTTPIPLDKLTDVVRLYFHGGNSVSFYTKTRNAAGNIPYESDFDMICLINPHIPDFARVRRIIFGGIISRLTTILNQVENTDFGEWKRTIIDYYRPYEFLKTIQYTVLEYKGPVSEDDRVLFDHTLMTRLKEQRFLPIPVEVTIVPNVNYTEEGRPKQLGIATIKMATTNSAYSKQIELLEITCPSRQYKHLETLWDVVDLTLATVDGYTFYVPTPVSLYLEQRIAYEGTPPSLSDKKSTRLTRSNNMKRYVRAKYNAGNAKIKFNLNSVIGDYEEPIWSYINNIKE